jgi:hypothetical protein
MSATYEFRPPLPQGAIVQALELSLPESAPPITPPSLPNRSTPSTVQVQADQSIAIYNWQSGSWDALPSGQQRMRVEQAAPYIGSEGQVRVQSSSPMGGSSYGSGALKLNLEGVMPG